jgi:hypothetical protein
MYLRDVVMRPAADPSGSSAMTREWLTIPADIADRYGECQITHTDPETGEVRRVVITICRCIFPQTAWSILVGDRYTRFANHEAAVAAVEAYQPTQADWDYELDHAWDT